MKHICLAGYDLDLLKEIEKQMRCYFDDHLSYSIWDFNVDCACMMNGIVVVFSDIEYHYALKHFRGEGQVILGKLTLTNDAYEVMSATEVGETVYFAHFSLELARSYVQHLYAFNFPFLIEPCSVENMDDFLVPIYASHTVIKQMSLAKENLIPLNGFLMDRSTLIHIGFSMDLDDIIYPQDLLNKYRPCHSSDGVLSEIINRNNQFRSELGMINQILDGSVIAIDIRGMVQIYNKSAQDLFGYPADQVVGREGLLRFNILDFDSVLQNKTGIKDKLIEVNGQDLILTINPIYHADKLYGVVAIIREFYEEEVKQHQFRKQIINKGHKAKYRFEDLKGSSQELLSLKSIAKRMSKSDSSVLIYGESGTGKELIAQAMHFTSERSQYQFVVLNCGALPESLLESELFGYEEGAFTGARKGGKSGLFELAHQGTIFLDEIGEMPISTQLRLLRVVQEREVMRIGSDRLIKIDVRIIAASNKNLKKLVKTGTFREDLYYRLSVLPLKVPSLRERKEDIIELVNYFKYKNLAIFDFDEEATELLMSYHWPGNIRELRNYVEFWTNLDKEIITKRDLPFLKDIEIEDYDSFNVKDVDFERYVELANHPLGVSVFLLNQLYISKNNDTRIGRHFLYEKARKTGFVISEHEIRHTLLQMVNFGYVQILKGRGGTVITPLGVNALNYLKQC